jgi:hypothetical protein
MLHLISKSAEISRLKPVIPPSRHLDDFHLSHPNQKAQIVVSAPLLEETKNCLRLGKIATLPTPILASKAKRARLGHAAKKKVPILISLKCR